MISGLQKLIGRSCLEYLDDVIFSKRRADHINDLQAVLDSVRAAGLKLKLVKCKMFCEQVLYLGNVITAAGMTSDPAKLRVLADWPVPTTVREIQSFLAFVNFYCNFIDELTAPTATLYEWTTARNSTEPVRVLAKHGKIFKEIKRRLCVAPQLAHPNLEAYLTLYTAASKIAVVAELHQRDANGFVLDISFFSKELSLAQRNYFTIERELLAVVCALEHFPFYFWRASFVFEPNIARCSGSF